MIVSLCLSFAFSSLSPTSPSGMLSPEEVAVRVTSVTLTPQHLPDEERAALAALNSLTQTDVQRLLASEDPHARGVGLYLADRWCLPELLPQFPHLIEDVRQTVPTAVPDAIGRLDYRKVTVAERFRDVWRTWHAHPVDSSLDIERFSERGVLTPWTSYRAWSVMLVRSQEFTPVRVAQLKQDIAALPDELRWLVACTALSTDQGRKIFTEAEIRALVLSINPATQQAILEDRASLPADMIIQFGDVHNTILHDRAKAALQGEPFPDPRERLSELQDRARQKLETPEPNKD